jgi:serine/threonine protein kinase/tetratricopeptide (TPR) repeat protein
MNSERWQRVKQLLEQAITLDPDERVAFLDHACAGDTELRREVDSLLSSHEQAGTGFLKNPVVNLATAAAEPTVRAGRHVGAYQIVEEIGHGGMGDVYRAIRADGQYTKEVAVKLVRGGFDSASVQEGFRNERQILASLDHPNIARLLDGGTTDDGVPYLVMELIEGTRIDSYCDEHKLSITERLRLFQSVCAAVQFAHQRLVIHRDIKPGNILVTKEGVPKLLDFGIAKILDPAASGDETVTIARALTPEYASPEQIRGEPITTASDVYSLGVVLYQLLTGRSPYPGETRTSLELARAVCDSDPGRPSTAVLKPQTVRSGDRVEHVTAELISSSREGTPAKLQRRLAGDLDNIVLMALRKEPNRRYPSAEQLSEDIRRHIEALPVTATKGSWKYRAGKFVVRHKASVAASAVVVLALVAGVGATVRAARIARQQAEIARAERVRAEKRFNDVRKLANSLIFEIHDSIQDLPGATPSRKLLLDRAVEYLDKLDQDATGDADLQRELAMGYQRLAAVQGDTSQSNLGEISAAEVSIRKSIGLFEAVAKANPHNVTDQLNLAMAYRRRAFTDIFEKNGRQEIDQALSITEPLMQTDADKVEVRNERALELQILANVQDATGERLKAIDTFRQHLTLRQDIERASPDYKGIHQGVVHATIQLAFEIGRFGNKDEALDLMNRGVAQYEAMARESKNQDVARNLAASVLRRGVVYLMRGDASAALADIRSARETTARLAKRDPKNAMLLSDMCGFDFDEGRALTANGKPAAGLALLQESSACYRDLHLEADTGPGIGLMESWTAEALKDLHNLPEVLPHYQTAAKALAGDVDKYDDARCDLATLHTKIAATLLEMGKVSEASAEYTQALDTAKVDFSRPRNDFPALNAAANAYAGLGDVAALQARKAQDSAARTRLLAEARADYEKSLSTWKDIPNPSRINGSGYRTEQPQDVAQRLAQLANH